MSISMPAPQVEGIRLTVMPFRPDAVIGTMGLPTLIQLVPSPRNQENKRALQYASGAQRRHAEVRGLVQRTIQKSSKGKNITPYAEYIAKGLTGGHGAGWSTPPVTLWLADELGWISDELVPGTAIRNIALTPGSAVIAVDGETQVSAWHELYDSPETFSLTYAALRDVRVPFELYWGLGVDDARQIFYDRNVEGVSVAKNLAMSMDGRDLCTQIARQVADAVKLEHNGELVALTKFLETRSRQLKKTGSELVTLSALREMVVTTLHGRRGLGLSAAQANTMPTGVSVEHATRRLTVLLSALIARLALPFVPRTAVSAPAVMAGIGIAAHQATGWAVDGRALSEDELFSLLASVRWEREARYWHGVAASVNANGVLNFGGGAKDSGGRVANALLEPDSEYGRKIRGY
ncbi:DNA sulfur modification protein DndB [Saccharopolyspora hirsuta]|uniref:DNA sulfur modification protein DndB n=1 Tax=Saccharopolyspora hirsuta TaxID=1837 RepID=UPI00331D3602